MEVDLIWVISDDMSLLVTEEVGSGQDLELGLVETDNPNYWDWYVTLVSLTRQSTLLDLKYYQT